MVSCLTKLKKLQGKKWLWRRDGNIERETEALIITTEEETIRPNGIKTKLDKTEVES